MNIMTLIIPIIILGGVLFYAPNLIWAERRLLALWQDRFGPNRLGPFGLFQTVADAIKMFFKEDFVPSFCDKPIFILAPAIIMFTSLISFAFVPIIPGFIVFDSSVGLLIFIAISSLGSYSIILAGFASNNKYSLLGALRGAAQVLSYEAFMTLSLLGVVALTGSFRLEDIVFYQANTWNIVPQFIGFIVFYIAALAETHRLPFDLMESESEIIAGFHSEYSGLKFGMFFVAEYVGVTFMASMITLLFLGGWQGPFLPPIAWFILKTSLIVCSFFLVRATFPRPRYDQFILFGWQVLLPLSLLNLLAVSIYVVLF